MKPFRVKGNEIISSPFHGKFRISSKDGIMHRDKKSISIRPSNNDYFGVTLMLHHIQDSFSNIQINSADLQGKVLYLIIEEFCCQNIVLVSESDNIQTRMNSGDYLDGIFRLPLKIFEGEDVYRELYFWNTSKFKKMTEIGIEHDTY